MRWSNIQVWAWAAVAFMAIANPALGQFYTFTSGPSGDGFSWPASPTGLIDGDFFFTPDGVDFSNFTADSVFFDSNYLVASNSSEISGDALWGNPNGGTLDVFFSSGVQDVQFNFANSVGGAPGNTPDFIDIYVEDSDGRSTFFSQSLGNTFTGLGGFDGYSDIVQFDTSFLVDDDFNVDGGPFVDISFFYIDLFALDNTSDPAEFAIDDFNVDGSGGPGGEVFPSVNQGQFDVTGSTLGGSSLRGVGTFDRGIEVTNGSAVTTTYSVQIVPGGDLTPGTLPTGDSILVGQSIFSPGVASIDRSLPSGTYASDFTVVNNGDPTDPDNTVTIDVDLYEPQILSGNFASVNVSSGDDVNLGNAAAPANGFRAAVKVTGTQTTGPFQVDGIVGERVLDGGLLQSNVTFNRFGQLSGLRTGTFTAQLDQTAFIVNGQVDFEIFLANAESVPDQVWNLEYTLVNTNTDSANFSPGSAFVNRIGVNTFDIAATLIDGSSDANQSIGFQTTANPDTGASAELIGDAVDLVFGAGADDLFVLQMTYNDGSLPVGVTENDLLLLTFDTSSSEWVNAIDENTGGTPTFFSGSYDDYLSALGGGLLDAADLGVFGLDTTNNHVWGVLNHASLFAVGAFSPSVVTGDYDDSGSVGQGDLDIVLLNWGSATFPGNPLALQGGGPFDGQVGQDELDGVLLNWGNTALAATASVPEPSTLMLSLVGLCLAVRRKR